MREQHPVRIEKDRCIRCGSCVRDCPRANIRMTDGGAEIIREECLYCAHCVAVCPTGAVSMVGFMDAPVDKKSMQPLNGDDLLHHIMARRSIRQFRDTPIPEAILEKILQAGQYTPTAGNQQNVSYLVLKEHLAEYETLAINAAKNNETMIRVLSGRNPDYTVDEHFYFKGAPVVIVVSAPYPVDAAMAACSMELTAQAYGIGVLYSGYFTIAAEVDETLKKQLALECKPVVTMVLGYPAVAYHRTAPKEIPVIRYD